MKDRFRNTLGNLRIWIFACTGGILFAAFDRCGYMLKRLYLGHIGKSSAQDHFSPDSAAAPSYDSGGAALVDIVGCDQRTAEMEKRNP